MLNVSKIWKDAVVVPVSKSTHPTTQNDFRPIALTSIIMEIFENWSIQKYWKTECALCQMQIVYRQRGGVEDAKLSLHNLLLKHLKGLGVTSAFIRRLFFRF